MFISQAFGDALHFVNLFPAQPWPSSLQDSSCHQGPQDHQQQSSRSCEGHRPGAQRDAGVRVKRRDGPGRSRAALRRHVQSLPGIQPRWGTRLKQAAKYLSNSSRLGVKTVFIAKGHSFIWPQHNLLSYLGTFINQMEAHIYVLDHH